MKRVFADLLSFALRARRLVWDRFVFAIERRLFPGSFPHRCTYCGGSTSVAAYTEARSGTRWPACCANCVDKWEPIARGTLDGLRKR